MCGGGKTLNDSLLDFIYFTRLIFTGAWFLTVLFILNVLGALIEHYFSSNRMKIWLVCYGIIYFLPSFFMSNEMKFLMPFFIIGILWKKYHINNFSIYHLGGALIVFILCFRVYSFDSSLYAMKNNVFELDYHIKSVIRLLSGISGIVCVCCLCKYIPCLRYLSKFLLYIGTTTLPIYVLHQKFLMPNMLLKYTSNNLLIITFVSICCVFLSIMFYRLLRRFHILRLICFGEK